MHCKRYYKQNEKKTEGEKIFANNVTDKELVSKIYKQLTLHIARGEETLGPEPGGDGGLATGESAAAERLRGPSAPGWPVGSGEYGDSWADQWQISSRLVAAVRLECLCFWVYFNISFSLPQTSFPVIPVGTCLELGLQVD